MSRLTVNIDSSKSEEVVVAVLKALGLSYKVEPTSASNEKDLSNAELAIYNRLKQSFEDVKLHEAGKIKLKTIEEVLAEIS